MKLSDIKGRRAVTVMAQAMELADAMDEMGSLGSMVEEIGKLGDDSGNAWKVMCKHLPKVLNDKRCSDLLLGLLATANGVPVEEYEQDGDVVGDLFSFVMSDWDALGFLSKRERTEM